MAELRVHMCLDIRGALRWSPRQLAGILRHEHGAYATAEEAWEYLADQLAKGRSVLPMGKPCEGFSYESGCPGHPLPHAPGNGTAEP